MVGVGGVSVRNSFVDAACLSAITIRRFAVWICWPCVTFVCAAFNLTVAAFFFGFAAVLFRVAWAIPVFREVRCFGVIFAPNVAAFLCKIALTVFVVLVGVI